MKTFLFVIIIPSSHFSRAQICGINITYDENGNCIKREMLCPVPKTSNSGSSKTIADGQEQAANANSTVAGLFKVYPQVALPYYPTITPGNLVSEF